MDISKEIAFLSNVATQLHLEGGPPVFPPHPQSAPPGTIAPDAPAIHLVVRRPGRGSWNEFPGENWIVLSKQEWGQFLPPAGAAVKSTWQLPAPVATKLVEWIYPQTEETRRTNRSRVDTVDVHLTLTAKTETLARARIDARARLLHSFYPGKPHEDYATSELVGFADFDLVTGRVQRFRMVTHKADYNGQPFSCSLASVSRETIEAQR